MVLQSKQAKQASRRYAKAHATELGEDDVALQAAVDEINKRRLGSNADRYKEDDELQALASGEAGPSATAAAEVEVDEEEEARKAEEAAELAAFRERQREKLLLDPSSVEGDEEEDDEDVDHSFAHLRIGGAKGKGAHRGVAQEKEDDEQVKARADEARRMQAVRDLKDRFSGARPLPPPVPSTSSPRPFTLPPPKSGVQPAKKGQDFLDDLL